MNAREMAEKLTGCVGGKATVVRKLIEALKESKMELAQVLIWQEQRNYALTECAVKEAAEALKAAEEACR